jgi:transposase InsO family protein
MKLEFEYPIEYLKMGFGINSPAGKIDDEQKEIIISLHKNRKLGTRRIQSELKRLHRISLSLATIHKVIKKHDLPYLQKKRHYRKIIRRYNCKIPGQRIQMDVCKIAAGLYQYTAIDDCSRYKILALFRRRSAKETLEFIDQVIVHMPFPIQRIQTDRGQEFFAYDVQECLKNHKIKLRPIRPASPHLNGKVERSQRTDLDEFYDSVDLKDIKLAEKLSEWEKYYNHNRSHSSLHGMTPFEKYHELKSSIPTIAEIHANYDKTKESFAIWNYKDDQAVKAAFRYQNLMLNDKKNLT